MITPLTESDIQGNRARQGAVVNMKVPIRKADLVMMRKINELVNLVNAEHP